MWNIIAKALRYNTILYMTLLGEFYVNKLLRYTDQYFAQSAEQDSHNLINNRHEKSE